MKSLRTITLPRVSVVIVAMAFVVMMVGHSPLDKANAQSPSRGPVKVQQVTLVTKAKTQKKSVLSQAALLPEETLMYSVLNTQDSGPGSLRQAIQDANAHSGEDTIEFNITGSGPHTIQVSSQLPTITDTLVIDGYSQPGSVANTAPSPQPFNGGIKIALVGSGDVGIGLRLSAGNSVVKGMAIGGFRDTGVHIDSSANTIEGNYIGTDAAGLFDRPNSSGVLLENGSNNTIGGVNPAQRNVVSGNSGMNIFAHHSNGNKLKGNYVGLAANGNLLPSNAWYGVGIGSSQDTVVGGASQSEGNVIAGNQVQAGFVSSLDSVPAERNKIQGNLINTDINGQTQTGYGGLYAGLGFGGNAHDNILGGSNPGEGNTLGGTAQYANIGIAAIDQQVPSKNSIVGNRISVTPGGLGLDLGEITSQPDSPMNLGRTANDPDDLDGGPNDYLNYPEISKVAYGDTAVTMTFSLDIRDSAPVQSYRIEFFASKHLNNNGDAAGDDFIGSVIVPGDVDAYSVDVPIPTGISMSDANITATATEIDSSADGYGSTSEFSRPVQAMPEQTLLLEDAALLLRAAHVPADWNPSMPWHNEGQLGSAYDAVVDQSTNAWTQLVTPEFLPDFPQGAGFRVAKPNYEPMFHGFMVPDNDALDIPASGGVTFVFDVSLIDPNDPTNKIAQKYPYYDLGGSREGWILENINIPEYVGSTSLVNATNDGNQFYGIFTDRRTITDRFTVAIRWDRQADTLTMFINGQRNSIQGNPSLIGLGDVNTDAQLLLSGGNIFHNVAIFDRAVSDTDIATIDQLFRDQ